MLSTKADNAAKSILYWVVMVLGPVLIFSWKSYKLIRSWWVTVRRLFARLRAEIQEELYRGIRLADLLIVAILILAAILTLTTIGRLMFID